MNLAGVVCDAIRIEYQRDMMAKFLRDLVSGVYAKQIIRGRRRVNAKAAQRHLAQLFDDKIPGFRTWGKIEPNRRKSPQ